MEAALADFCEELADPAFLLHALLSLGRLQAVGALTSAEQQWATAHDPLFSDLFSVVHVTPPEVEEVITILDRAKLWPEERYRLRFPQETLEAIARVVLQLGQTRTLPDAAVDLLSAVAGHLRRSDDPALPDARQVRKELAETQQQKEQALDEQRYDDAIDLRYQEAALQAQLEAVMGSESEVQGHMEVTPETVALVYAEQSGLPLDTVVAAMAMDG